MINVTKTFLPPQQEYQKILQEAWDAGWITNRGGLVRRLEQQLSDYLGVDQIIAMTNGTLPLQIAIKALGLSGEIITTPFSYVATTSCIAWEGCSPVFVDIDPASLTIDETQIEAAITSETSAILATHVFGNPCNIEAIDAIAQKHNLKVIYDAAHCFGVKYKGQSIFNYGHVSTCSFHATKVFQTGEGGAFFCSDKALYDKAFYMHNFGHEGKESFQGQGINAKMSELQAAMGLAVMPYVDQGAKARANLVEIYKKELSSYRTIQIREGTDWNYSYFPILFENEASLKKVQGALNKAQIFPRRYFYPSLNHLPYVKNASCPISEQVAQQVLCMPLYQELASEKVLEICSILKQQG